jgi:hypothetical protein
MRYLVSFNSTAQAIKAEKFLLETEIKIKIRPLPNEISSGCGISIIFDDLEGVKKLFEAKQIAFNRMYTADEKVYFEIA